MRDVHYRFWTTDELRTEGWSKRSVADAVAQGRLTVVRRGHYAAPGTPEGLIRAMRVGGPATASTATQALGIWTEPDPLLDVAVPLNSPRLRDPDDASRTLAPRDDVRLHWVQRLKQSTSATGMVPLLVAFQHLLPVVRSEFAVAALDSALHDRFLRPRDLPTIAAGVPRHLRPLTAAADGRCESGIESITRYRLQLLGLGVEVQVPIDGVGRVDLLVEGRLIIELDGRQWHPDFERDRGRDAAAAIGRYRTLRFTWAQVLYDWPRVQEAVLAALAA
jgi:very-short-patch-repair endonuclease